MLLGGVEPGRMTWVLAIFAVLSMTAGILPQGFIALASKAVAGML